MSDSKRPRTSTNRKDGLDVKESPSLQSRAEILVRLSSKEMHLQTLTGELYRASQGLLGTDEIKKGKRVFDPSISLLFNSMRKELQEKQEMIVKLQKQVEALEFVPTSTLGQRLIEKCDQLKTENESLGRQIGRGQLEHYETELELMKRHVNELKESINDRDRTIEEQTELIEQLQIKVLNLKSAKDDPSRHSSKVNHTS